MKASQSNWSLVWLGKDIVTGIGKINKQKAEKVGWECAIILYKVCAVDFLPLLLILSKWESKVNNLSCLNEKARFITYPV